MSASRRLRRLPTLTVLVVWLILTPPPPLGHRGCRRQMAALASLLRVDGTYYVVYDMTDSDRNHTQSQLNAAVFCSNRAGTLVHASAFVPRNTLGDILHALFSNNSRDALSYMWVRGECGTGEVCEDVSEVSTCRTVDNACVPEPGEMNYNR